MGFMKIYDENGGKQLVRETESPEPTLRKYVMLCRQDEAGEVTVSLRDEQAAKSRNYLLKWLAIALAVDIALIAVFLNFIFGTR